MRREVELKDISDGKLYESNDLCKLGCNDCEGCSSCCRGMEDTIVLDPYDIWNLTNGLNTTCVELLNSKKIEIGMVDGVILMHMALNAKGNSCNFLNEEGRCDIHSFRPGICRLFPLGRYYENESFKYILQTNECKKENRTKVKIKSFLGIPELKKYEEYINDWHYYIKEVEAKIVNATVEGGEAYAKELSMSILNTFYITPYEREDFYTQYYERRKMNVRQN